MKNVFKFKVINKYYWKKSGIYCGYKIGLKSNNEKEVRDYMKVINSGITSTSLDIYVICVCKEIKKIDRGFLKDVIDIIKEGGKNE